MQYNLRGLVKLKTIQKSEKTSDWSDPKHPPPYPFFIFFFVQQKNNTEKNQIKKKDESELELEQVHPLSNLSRIFLFFLT